MASDQQQAYCPVCERETEVESTVPWQEDICANCGNSIPGSDGS
jgi:methionyl-tRNA synthetase